MSQHRTSAAAAVVGLVLFAGFVSCTADHSTPGAATVPTAPVVATTTPTALPLVASPPTVSAVPETTTVSTPSWDASELGSSSYSGSSGSSSSGSSSSYSGSGGYGDTYTNVDGNEVERPDSNSSGATAVCKDGTDSHSQHRSGTCSGHGGVARWL